MPSRLAHSSKRGGGVSSPPYPFKHSGPCIIAGNAWCLHDDLKKALEIYPKAPIIAVNGAAKEIKAFALFSYHPDRFQSMRWIKHQQRFGGDFTVHSIKPSLGVEYVWENANGGGGSAWGARKIAWFMGFDLAILCGCPLKAGNYADGHSLNGLMQDEKVILDLQAGILNEPEWHEGAYSMSGFTKEVLGEPMR